MYFISFHFKGHLDEAISGYKNVLKINNLIEDLNRDIYHNMGSIYEEINKIDEAIECYKNFIELSLKLNLPVTSPKGFNIVFKLTGMYKKNKKFTFALDMYKKSINLYPDDSYSYINIIEIFIETKKFQEAMDMCNMAIEIFDNYDAKIAYNSDFFYPKEVFKYILASIKQ